MGQGFEQCEAKRVKQKEAEREKKGIEQPKKTTTNFSPPSAPKRSFTRRYNHEM